MPPVLVPERVSLVMAHPDDEILWASSLLAKAEKVVLCFGDVQSQPSWSEGRRRSLQEYPLANVMSLEMQESEVFDGAAWPEPVETDYGLAVRLGRRSPPGFSEARYCATHGRLVAALRPILAGSVAVVTHSPWGEYGHEEHVQVFRAVADLQAEMGFALWIPGYVSNKSYLLMLRYLPRLHPQPTSLSTDPALGERIKKLYARHGCWTWFADYQWPETEHFYRWRGAGEESVQPRPGSCIDLNHLWINWRPTQKPSLKRRIRSLLPLSLPIRNNAG